MQESSSEIIFFKKRGKCEKSSEKSKFKPKPKYNRNDGDQKFKCNRCQTEHGPRIWKKNVENVALKTTLQFRAG